MQLLKFSLNKDNYTKSPFSQADHKVTSYYKYPVNISSIPEVLINPLKIESIEIFGIKSPSEILIHIWNSPTRKWDSLLLATFRHEIVFQNECFILDAKKHEMFNTIDLMHDRIIIEVPSDFNTLFNEFEINFHCTAK